MSRADKAEALFREGYNCCQSVFGAFTDVTGLDLEAAMNHASPFGAGFGKLREVCGAVSGMTMMAGYLRGYSSPTDRDGKIAGFYQQIPVAHVEAGLRTYDIYSPWPEEMNRQITGRIATYNFSPTQLSRKNLLKENITDSKITVTGNTVIDALHWVTAKIKNDKKLDVRLTRDLQEKGYDSKRLQDGKRLVLITGHRRENFGEGFLNICNAIKDLAAQHPDVDFVYPMHLNPNVRKPIHDVFGEDLSNLGNIFFIEPLEYLMFVFLMEKANIVLTDSGGIQEEAPGLGKPVLVMRDTTTPMAVGLLSFLATA